MATAINEAKAHSIPLVVAGCVPQGDKKSKDLEVSIFAHSSSCTTPSLEHSASNYTATTLHSMRHISLDTTMLPSPATNLHLQRTSEYLL